MNLSEMQEFLKEVILPKYHGSGNLPIPSKLDSQYADFIYCYMELDEKNRDNLRKALTVKHTSFFLGFARRMASYAVRKKSEKEIYRGLGAIFFQAGIGDSREDIIIYTLLYDAALKIGAEPDSLFLKAAKDFNYSQVSEIHKFLKRSDIDKTPEVMGYIEGADKDGFLYIRTW